MSKILPILAGVVALTAAPAAADEFRHPAGAYSVRLPEGWEAQSVINAYGHVYHLFSPDPGGDKPGFRIYSLPIPPGNRPTLDSSAAFAIQVATSGWDPPDPKRGRAARLGKLDGRAFDLTKDLVYSTWRGDLRLAVGKDYLYVAHAEAGEQDWAALQDKYEATLATFAVPDPPAFGREPLKVPERGQDVDPRVVPAVPQVLVLCRADPDDPDVGKMRALGHGSGVILTEDGYAVTNRHVVERRQCVVGRTYHRLTYDPVRLRWAPETELPDALADVVAVSPVWDLALLRIRGPGKWSAVPLADPRHVRRQHDILVAGWPALDGQPVVFTSAAGKLTAVEPHSDGRPRLYRHSARTTNGNSGGLVYDLDLGGMIGVHAQGLISTAKDFADVVAHGAVPVGRVFEEFPQLVPGGRGAPEAAGRPARIATFFHARRPTAALVECDLLSRERPGSGVANAFKYRVLARQGEPGAVTDPLARAAEADPVTAPLTALWRGRSALEAADWDGLRRVLEDNWLGAAGVKKSVGYAGLTRVEVDQLFFCFLGRTPLSLGVIPKGEAGEDLFLTGSGAEAEVLTAVNDLRQWMLEKRVTALPAADRPTAVQARRWRELLGYGVTHWPACHELAALYLAYLEAAVGNTEKADELFELSYDAGRRDTFYLSNAAYYCVLRGRAASAFRLACEAHTPASPGTHFILGRSLQQLAGLLRTLDLKDETLAASADRLGQLAKDRGLIPADTKVPDLADRMEAAGRRMADEALVRVRHTSQYLVLEEQRKKLPAALVREDNWWGPFVYLHHKRVWNRQTDPMEERWLLLRGPA